AFIGIADHVFLRRLRLRHGAPLDAGRKGRATPAAKPGIEHLLPDLLGSHCDRGAQARPSTMGLVVRQRERLRDAHASEAEALLAGEVWNLLDQPERQWMPGRAETVGENRWHVLNRHRTVAKAAFRRIDLHERLEPKQSTRAVAHDLGLQAPYRAFGNQGI